MAARRGVVVVQQDLDKKVEEEGTKIIEVGRGTTMREGNGSNDSGENFKPGNLGAKIEEKRGNSLESTALNARIGQNLTTPRGHGRRDGEMMGGEGGAILYKGVWGCRYCTKQVGWGGCANSASPFACLNSKHKN